MHILIILIIYLYTRAQKEYSSTNSIKFKLLLYYYYYIMWALQYIHDNLSKWHGVCWALHTKWYLSVRIEEEKLSYTCQGQNKIGGAHLCHCNACMIICWKCMAFAGHCTQSGTHQWESTKKVQVKHYLGGRLYGGQGQNKIGGAHICHVGIAMHVW